MIIYNNTSLKELNTFHIDAKAKKLVEIENETDIKDFSLSELAKEKNIFILGGGSNILFTGDFDGVLLHSKINHIEVVNNTEEYVDIKCGSGVEWDSFVAYCVKNNWGGLENLSDIPGNVGASPVQNIGAYGVEAKDNIILVETMNYNTGKKELFSNSECSFDYRNSIFKQDKYKSYFITFVHFRLTKKHKLITHYGKIEEELSRYPKKNIQNIREVIINTRRSKLPTVDELGSAGSFFKNPVVDIQIANKLLKQFDQMPQYDQPDNMKKLSSAWLIDNAGLKGLRKGNVGTFDKQPLVIVNYGKAKGKDIADFSRYIQQIVQEKFNIILEPEVIFK